MLTFLSSRASERKFRLFAVACCHRMGGLLSDPRNRQGLVVLERFADALATREDLRAATAWAGDLALHTAANSAFYSALQEGALQAAQDAAEATAWAIACAVSPGPWSAANQAAEEAEQAAQCCLLHDLFGPLPFRRVVIEAAWWTGNVRGLAAAIYEERQFADFPVLADALEEAGCPDAELLAHLRAPGPHARGCWALDLVLAKE
jgi:hypothetical protein